MDTKWLEDLKINIPNYLQTLNQGGHKYLPVKSGLTDQGASLNLGFSCYALKIYYITNQWDNLKEEEKTSWIAYINSFQKKVKGFPSHSFVDKEYLVSYLDTSYVRKTKNLTKLILNITFNKKYILDSERLINSIRAESKQAISTLSQIGSTNELPYFEFTQSKKEIKSYLEGLDWTKPWNAGAQFSALCVFVQTQITAKSLKKDLIKTLEDFIVSISHEDSGLFYSEKKPSDVESVNGAMKIITGLDWIGVNPPYPERLIETFLNIQPNDDGCDLVDTVYVLYMCSKLTNYKKTEIESFLISILDKIKNHYYPDIGGFSYFNNRSQTHYYGVNISDGNDTPDIHGTILLTWAISMISKMIDLPTSDWKVLKP
ncbi:MAG: hypothetical protein CBD44_00995 [Flavobacteriaceae bacterium TMED184]|nr:MAG: hypothetical protein CBD44_00995 [Flavobacteriaceae bacterium TMED184]|tara:strand:- start:10890 stop:12008 length:1119 start_codon:yes stop_codon:yes gene_type:complete